MQSDTDTLAPVTITLQKVQFNMHLCKFIVQVLTIGKHLQISGTSVLEEFVKNGRFWHGF